MSLLKIGDDLLWQKITDAKTKQRTSHTSETMDALRKSQVTIQERKAEIEAALAALASKKTPSAWQAALLHGDDVGSQDQLLKEYRPLEERERFNAAAIQEGVQALDAIKGKEDMEICLEITPALQKAVIPEARAGARQLIKAMETQERIVNLLLENDVRADHLGRVSFPMSRERLETFLREIEEPG
jgi:hypothetical protein